MNRSIHWGIWAAGLWLAGWLGMLPDARGQENPRSRTWRIMEYNVENLFDTIHSAAFADGEFTPQGSHRWSSSRYWAKLSRLGRVIAAVGEDVTPACIALVEVENDSVVSHLTRRTKLWRMGYHYLITHSRDPRGINVALLYQPHLFRPLMHDSLRVAPQEGGMSFTRDVLHVAGLLGSGDTLDLWLCHWPSRRNGARSERYRNRVAAAVRAQVDSVLRLRRTPLAVITGDFNAYWPEASIRSHLGARLPEATPMTHELYLLSSPMKAREGIGGTYKFQGEWNQLDNFVVSGLCLSAQAEATFRTSASRCRIVDFAFLLQGIGSESGVRPWRTYLGEYYQGGFSDHLPLVLDFEVP